MLIKKLFRFVFKDKQAIALKAWYNDNGDETLRLNYPGLNNSSVVMDLGGYEGQWANEIFIKYNCTVYVFEPYLPYAEGIELRFKDNSKIKVFAVGLGKTDADETLHISANRSSLFKKEGPKSEAAADYTTTIKIVKATDFIKQHGIDVISLMKINIEGGEYDLLEELIDEGTIQKIENIQVQFHDFFPAAVKRMKAIRKKLAVTHQLTYQYDFVWENWKLNAVVNTR
ncbi:FkbM family methyltransferase [Mucilaginibacter xinganensis]|uniref:Methyltransferase FkbM domain-containing protein n=1 Tax=Mucilaginibacter xinganensis TaxID=1234841 RepID=A0A223NX16_9SPHI|nr:FkbM family methyltransferase [Mucilaginibacter xinganensis]ASU34138.1 hypothetical protein MuYL_2248 [Mucilaginibacter xinganensis]